MNRTISIVITGVISLFVITSNTSVNVLAAHCPAPLFHDTTATDPNTAACVSVNPDTSGSDTTSTFDPKAANNGQKLALNTGFGFSTLGQAINTIISVIFFVAALAAFFYILLGAFTYVTAGDDATKTEKARKSITNAVVGLILVALVYVIWLIVINTVPGIKSFFA